MDVNNINSQETLLNEMIMGVNERGQLPLNYLYLEGVFNQTFISYCILKNKTKELKLLLEAGADIKATSPIRHNATALHDAVKLGRLECVKMLLEFGADLHEKDYYGHELIWCTSNAEVLQFFHSKGFNLNQRDEYGVSLIVHIMHGTPGQHEPEIKEDKNEEIGKIIDMGIIDINYPSIMSGNEKEDRTPLMMSYFNNNKTVMKKLIFSGADFYYKSGDGKTLLDLAQERVKNLPATSPAHNVYRYLLSVQEKLKLEGKLQIKDESLGLEAREIIKL